MYVGNFSRGLVILMSALAIGFFSFAFLIGFGVFAIIPSFIFYTWQIFDAAREYDKRR